jgi:hypothetical protein
MRLNGGFTYVVALFVLAVTSAAASVVAGVYSTELKQHKEAHLLWVGAQFRHAIGVYYARSPGSVPRYPETLEDLLEDRRYLSLQRYLRRIYADPMTGKTTWGTITAPTGGIMGVYSLSTNRPLKQARFDDQEASFVGARSYQDWKFVHVPVQAALTAPPPGGPR